MNATSITGYAKSKADALTQAGYTSVTPSNPTGNVPMDHTRLLKTDCSAGFSRRSVHRL